ncbi:hypothetical protein FIBSPDRAFT_844903 [Athelia psychrophila]|uniref:Uncharacterized protein n=1 Tax=Athelia psychrophila TaxID=1759441 RepID=A0A167U1K0_9AGAM|nr:hypothetical protein FIBSPDRAFT_844903 [Fibularhizoctonia sp. CBS 109695]
MATRRRIGVSLATTEAARRALMQPVPCWQKVWAAPENANPGSTLKVCKWVKTDKQQQFSDDEDEADVPLAPIQDEIEVVEGDEGDEEAAPEAATQEIPSTTAPTPAPEAPTPAVITNAPSPAPDGDAPSPSAMLSFQPGQAAEEEPQDDALDASLKPLESGMATVDDDESLGDIDMSALGPDGVPFEGAHDLNQVEEGDVLLGGPLMDDSLDPFSGQELVGMPDED